MTKTERNQTINLECAARIFQYLCTLKFDHQAKPRRCTMSKADRDQRVENFKEYNRRKKEHKLQGLTVWRNVSAV